MGLQVNQNNSNTNNGVGFCGLLAILFIGLKLTGVITWSWLWILSPLWIGLAFYVFLLLILAIIVVALK